MSNQGVGTGSNIKQLYSSVITTIDDDLDDFQPLKGMAKKFNLQPAHLAIGIVVLVSLFTFVAGFLAHLLITFLGLIYPSYMSFKAIHHRSDDLGKKWLTYWIIFGFLTAFDRLVSILLFFLPSYYIFKLAFLVWLFYPRTDGAHLVYDKFLKPNLLKFKKKVKQYKQQ